VREWVLDDWCRSKIRGRLALDECSGHLTRDILRVSLGHHERRDIRTVDKPDFRDGDH